MLLQQNKKVKIKFEINCGGNTLERKLEICGS